MKWRKAKATYDVISRNDFKGRMVSSGMLRRVALVRTHVSDRVTRIGELGITQAATSNRCTLRRNVGSYKSHTA
jgi:hypothetical protein